MMSTPASTGDPTSSSLPRRVMIILTMTTADGGGDDAVDLTDLIMAELATEGFEGLITPPEGGVAQGVFSIEEASDDAIEAGQGLVERLADQYGIEARLEVQTYDPAQPVAYTAGTLEPYTIADGRVWILPPRHERPADAPPGAHTLYMLESMAFGTGHHPTTQLMSAYVLDTPMAGARVIDAGTGTALLALLALRCGAAACEAFDHDATALAIAAEICELNGVTPGSGGSGSPLTLERGDLGAWQPRQGPVGVVLANITRNLNMAHMSNYAQWLVPGGQLITSGYFADDQPLLTQAAAAAGLEFVDHRTQEDQKGMTWCAARYRKAH